MDLLLRKEMLVAVERIAEIDTDISIKVADAEDLEKIAPDCKTELDLVGFKVGRIIAACNLLDQ